VGPDACVRYEAMVNPAPVDVSFWLQPDARVDGTILAMSRWLWFPSRYAEGPVVTARFSVPPSLHLSLPWPRVGPDTFRVDASSFTREGYVGLSRRPVVEVTTAGATLSVAGLNGALTSDDGPARAWLTRSAALVAGLYGAFPATAVQVLLVGRADLAAPTGFGLASSAGGASVLFLVRPGADAAALAADDTAIHEFVHLGQAVTATANYWLGEGLATYYQHVLRARAGLITPAAAWTTLHQGFTRGRADRSGHSLTDDSAALHREHRFSRVYWTGAALALLADVALRSGTPARTLDDAVRAALAGCGDRSREYGAAEILACMDAAGGGPVLTNLAARYAASVEFPGLGPLYERLGLRVVGDRVELGAAPDAALRDAIMAPRP
jgi:hypothetical protein